MSHFKIPVEEYTTPNPFTAKEDTLIDELSLLMKKNNIRHVPVVRKETVVGIISDRDIKVAVNLSSREKIQVRAADIMTVEPITVGAGTPLDEVAFEMSKNKIGSVIVNDENDEFLGIFTVTDALNALIEIVRTKDEDE
ncbi:MAG: histidine kinase [Bdellovibrionales bacterium RBG_16_40_8]|nr:MAG: histidine kinase [Bdellovibrionales bacterium RBG_16_40_8]